jgi:hypothetical protein
LYDTLYSAIRTTKPHAETHRHEMSLGKCLFAYVAQIDLSLHMAGDDGPYRRLGGCCRAGGIHPDLYIDEYVHVRTRMTIYIWPCGPLR